LRKLRTRGPTPSERTNVSSRSARFAILAVFIGLQACGGGGATEAQSPALFLDKAKEIYAVEPSPATCRSGLLLDTVKQKLIASLNEIRGLHGLGTLAYDALSDEQVMQAALMMAANAQTSHNPPTDWKCYSSAGAQGASTSNLSGGVAHQNLTFYTVEDHVIAWLTDINNAIPNNIGHRRWLLDPFLTKVAYGQVATAFDSTRVVDGAALKVIYPPTSAPAVTRTDYVAYPVGDYPAKYFANGALLSMSAIASPSDRFANASVDFSRATVSVTQRGGTALAVRNISYDNVGFGLPNNIQFNADGIAANTIYDVSIRGVKIGAVARDYSYWFRIAQ
jgi:uncharacterized protein YkwD